jgi:hypothetical protein
VQNTKKQIALPREITCDLYYEGATLNISQGTNYCDWGFVIAASAAIRNPVERLEAL